MVKVLIPAWGRTSVSALEMLSKQLKEPVLEDIAMVVKTGRKHMSEFADKVHEGLKNTPEAAQPHIYVGMDARHNYKKRAGFNSFSVRRGEIDITLEGFVDRKKAIRSLEIGTADIALLGYDELVSLTENRLSTETTASQWGAYNYNVTESNNLRVAGQAPILRKGLPDHVGFFLIGGRDSQPASDKRLISQNTPILVKEELYDLARYACKNASFVPTIEVVKGDLDAKLKDSPGRYAFELVQTGGRAVEKEYYLIGEPFCSQSVWVVNQKNYLSDINIELVLDILGTADYFDRNRAGDFARRYTRVSKALGERWIDKPNCFDLYVGKSHQLTNIGLLPHRNKQERMNPDYDQGNAQRPYLDQRLRISLQAIRHVEEHSL